MYISCLNNFIPPLPVLRGKIDAPSTKERLLHRSILSFPGTSLFLKKNGSDKSGSYVHNYSINKVEQLEDRCRVITLGDMKPVTGGSFSLYRRSSTGKDPSYCLPDTLRVVNAMDALVALFELVMRHGTPVRLAR